MIDVRAYHETTHNVTQSGRFAVIDLGNGNTIMVENGNATDPAFLAHIVW